VLHQTRLLTEARTTNIAIRSKHEVTEAVLLHLLPAENLQNYNSFPLAHRLGLIHSIPEYNFSMAKATIIDAIFLGLFPKGLIQVLQTYAQRFKNSRTADEQTFTNLMNKLITAVIYRPITMQKAIQNMLARERQDLELECSQRLNSTSTQPSFENTIMIIPPRGNLIVGQPTHAISTTSQICKTCYATRCRLLPAKGNHTRNMYCAPRKNMCSGCISESIRQKKTAQLERDILVDISPNSKLAPLLLHKTIPISLRNLKTMMKYLPTLQNNCSRDDHMYGAIRYLANTLGIKLENTDASEPIDPPLSDVQISQMWRTASFRCRCHDNNTSINKDHFGLRTFCTTCTYPVFQPISTQ